ncbi:MAG: arginine deiminase family protein [Asgard group archaeon]|nr:arginine deiminase family protein [Asgard group archaeon]
MEFGVNTEIGKLKKVLMHRPGKEMQKITKKTLSHYRFRAIPHLSKMQQEFNDFTRILENNGVEISLLATYTNKISNPNHLYMRDSVAVSTKGLIIMNMGIEGRKDEPKIVKEALKKEIPVHIEMGKNEKLEGGDLVYVDEKTLAIGYNPRSNLNGAKKIVKGMQNTSIETLLLVPLPPYRVHLDGAFTLVDEKLCVIHEDSLRYQPATIINKNKPQEKMLFLDYLDTKKFKTITCTDKETYNFGPNIFAIEAKKVISYNWNRRIIKELEKRNIEVIPLDGHELVKGGGGPHCMTCPVLRK